MRLFLLVVIALALVGCKSTPEVRYRDRYLPLEEHWILNCPLIAPPDITFYNNATDRQRAIVMTNSYVALLKEIGKCNVRLKEARDHNQRMIEKSKIPPTTE